MNLPTTNGPPSGPCSPNKPRGVARVNDRRALHGIIGDCDPGRLGGTCRTVLVPTKGVRSLWDMKQKEYELEHDSKSLSAHLPFFFLWKEEAGLEASQET